MITKKIFNDLAIFMISFGIIVGLAFPFFVLVTGTPSSYILTPLFFTLCIIAGSLVGLFNIFLSRKIVGTKISQLSHHMSKVEKRIQLKDSSNSIETCLEDNCYISINSKDEIGDSAKAFNSLVSSLAKSFKTEATVKSFTELLSSYLELDKLAEEALDSLRINMKAEGGAIIIEKEGELKILTSFRIQNPETLLKNEIVWKVMTKQKRIMIDFPDDITLTNLVADFNPKNVIVDPIKYKDITLGVLILAGTKQFDQDSQNLMELFRHGLALAFRNAITYSQLQRLAANDPLTGIYNRRFGLQRLKEEFSRSIRYDIPIGLIMFDIDHFKTINDNYGHIIGDKVLINLTKIIKSSLREGDIFFRYGGEEFVIVLPGASLKDTTKTAEQMRHIIEDMETKHNSQVIKITISLGGTSYPEHDIENSEEMLKIVDSKMYQAKESGRNISIID
ncbi:MAG: sensor domain-containing diguanylate cyclase [Candidatus Izimaplasma sp.]|nr:sensor domain-containing diguanylate cyclase [Candidatus Izimaplasma bacterium]